MVSDRRNCVIDFFFFFGKFKNPVSALVSSVAVGRCAQSGVR